MSGYGNLSSGQNSFYFVPSYLYEAKIVGFVAVYSSDTFSIGTFPCVLYVPRCELCPFLNSLVSQQELSVCMNINIERTAVRSNS